MPKDQLYTVVKPNGEHFTLDDIASLEDELRERDLELDDVLVFASAPLKLKRSLTIVDDEPRPARKPRKPKAEPTVDAASADEPKPDAPYGYLPNGKPRKRRPNGYRNGTEIVMNEDCEP